MPILTDFDIGKEIRVIKMPDKYRRKDIVVGTIGILKECFAGRACYGVKIPNLYNPASEKGLFWFTKDEIELIKKENKTMNIKNFEKGAKVCSLVKPSNPTDITFGVYYGELKEGDTVVCNYGYVNNALSVRFVVESELTLDDVPPESIECEVMGVADVSAYLEREHKKARRIELKAKMAERAKKYQEEAFWRMVAESDPDMAELIKEFDEVNK